MKVGFQDFVLLTFLTSCSSVAQDAIVVDFEQLPLSTSCSWFPIYDQGAAISGGAVINSYFSGVNETKVYNTAQPVFTPCGRLNPLEIHFDEPTSQVSFDLMTPNDFFTIEDDTGWSQVISVRAGRTDSTYYGTTVQIPSAAVNHITITDQCDYYATTGCNSQWRFAIDTVTFRFHRPCLSISGPTDVEPNRPRSNVDFVSIIITVDDCEGNPLSDVFVDVMPEAERFSGGHQHDTNRPNGRMRPAGATGAGDTSIARSTDAMGQVRLEFVAPEVAGRYGIKAECPPPQLGCLPPVEPHEIVVKVQGLQSIPYSLWYALSEPDGSPVGYTPEHPSNHFLTAEASEVLEDLSVDYAIFFATAIGSPPDLVHVNDASLPWGGVFDLGQNWIGNGQTGHAEHRRGTVVDLRANLLPGAIPLDMHDEFKNLARDLGAHAKVHGNSALGNEHFHVRLLGESE